MEINPKILEVADIYQRKYGTSDYFKKLQIAQMVHESANGESALAVEDNNFGGLTGYHKGAGQQPEEDGSAAYGHFDSLDEYATYLHDGFFAHYPEIHNATSAGEYATILYDNGYFRDNNKTREQDIDDYGTDMANIAGETYVAGAKAGRHYAGFGGLEKGVGPRVYDFSDDVFEPLADTNTGGFWKQAKDSFLNEWYNNGSVALLRTGYNTAEANGFKPTDKNWTPNENDLKAIDKYFPNDLETRHFLLANAKSQAQLGALIQQKRDDFARQERVEKAGYGLKSIGGILGTVADPLNFIPAVGQEALIGKMIARLGTRTLANLGANKVFQMAELGLANGLINMGDQYVAQQYGGYTPDYSTAFLFGAGMGAGARYFHSVGGDHKTAVGATPAMDRLGRQIEAETEQALMQASDLAVPKAPTKVADEIVLPKISETDFVKDKGYTNKGEWAEHLLHHKTSNEWKEARDFYGMSNSELKSKLKDYASLKDYYGRLEKTYDYTSRPYITKHNDGSVSVNDVDLSNTSVIANAVNAEDNNFYIPLADDEEIPFMDEGFVSHISELPESSIDVGLKPDDEIPLEAIRHSDKPPQALIKTEIKPEDDYLYMGQGGVSSPEKVMMETQGALGNKGALKQKAELTKVFGTTYGHLANSPSDTMRHFAKTMLLDPRDRMNNIGIPIELAKKVVQKDYKIKMAVFEDDFKKWYFERPRRQWFTPKHAKEEFNEVVSKAYHEKYRDGKDISHYGETINNAVEHVKDFREWDLKNLKQSGLVSEDFDGSPELYRRVSKDKLNLLSEKFVNEEAKRNFLVHYIERAVDRERLDEGIDLRTEAEAYADHIMRAGQHHFDDGEMKDIKGDKRLAYFKRRLPMNTGLTVPLKLSGGTTEKALNDLFSFDTDLRDTNIMNHMDYVSNRSSGAIAIKQVTGVDDVGALAHRFDTKIKNELEQAVQLGYVSDKEAQLSYEDFHRAFHHITGARIFEDVIPKPEQAMDRLQKVLLDASYAMNGMNFGLSALAEHAGAVSKVGARAFTHFIPRLHDFIHDLKHSKFVTAKQLADFRKMEIGTYMSESNWFDPIVTDRNYLENNIAGLHMEALGATHDGISVGARLTSTLSQVQQITNHSIQSIKADLVPDMIDWANDEFSSSFRKNLFSERAFKRVGIDNIPEFKAIVKHYLSDLDHNDPTALRKSLREWQKNDNMSYIKFHAFLDKHSMDAILQPHFSAGNTRLTGHILPILMQFKAFSRMALNSHLMRAMEHWQREDTIQTLATILSGGMLWAIRMRAQAEYMYGNDEKRKQKFLDKTFTADNIITAGLTRSSILSPLSFGDDARSLIFGRGSTARTTVDRPEWTEDGQLIDGIADRAKQFAVLGSAIRLFNGARTSLEAIGALEDNQKNGKGQNALTAVYPLDRYLPIQIFLTGMADMAHKEQQDFKRVEEENARRIPVVKPQVQPQAQPQPKPQPQVHQPSIQELLKDPKKRKELTDGLNAEKPEALKGRNADDLSDDELANLYNEYRQMKGQ